MKDQGRILRFWRDVEVFTIPSPATYKDGHKPGAGSTLPTVSVEKFTEPRDLPWLTSPPAPPLASDRPAASVGYVVYLGVQDMTVLAEKVLQAVTPDATLREKDLEGISGQGCLGVLCVNQEGVPLAETYTAASFVLGVEAYRKGTGLDALTKRLADAQQAFDERRFSVRLADEEDQEDTEEAVPGEEGGEPESEQEEESPEPRPPLTWGDIREECGLLFDCLGIDPPEPLTITVKTTVTPPRKEAAKGKKTQPQPEMLNSFYLNDLDALIRQCDNKESFGPALSAYLGTPSKTTSRRDILKDDSAMRSLLDPAHLPSGRWPSFSEHHLMLGQQAAVSGILARIGEGSGLVAVNGPPGTGKTTLLGDIIAEVVVKRAERISCCDQPWHVFDGKLTAEGCAVFPLKREIARHTGVVVSSNNNSAVENITLDLPSNAKIDTTEHPEASYFPDVIRSVFSRANISAEPWGLVAGALGSKANRKRFFAGFLWGSQDKHSKGMKGILSGVPRDGTAEKRWLAAKNSFLALKKSIEAQKAGFNSCYRSLALRPKLAYVERQLEAADSVVAALLLDRESRQAAVEIARLEKPGLLSRLSGGLGLKTRDYQAWEQRQVREQRALQSVLHDLRNAQSQKDALVAEQSRLKAEVKRHGPQAACSGSGLGPVPDEAFFCRTREEQHLGHVWTTDAFDLLRSQYFLAALELHEATIYACSGKFLANFDALNSMLTKQGYFSREARAALWDTLFFTVPVVSTTLASCDRLFAGMEQDSIGWLLIDEAGQATPQSVAGALWRSRRAVIIGDPLQIEPVLTIPEQLVVHIQKKYGLDEDWSPKLHSAQTLADRTMDFGAWVGSGESAVWTGLPLRAHRRCTEPMFGVSNEIAYDNQMVQANTQPAPIRSCLGKSAWFDVRATSSDGQIVQAEMDELRRLLEMLKQDWPMVSGKKKAGVYVISPFRRVAGECRRVVNASGLGGLVQAGTVHTFQGKEADLVCIVLGSAPGRSGAGSRAWASEKPNLLNVALTRAKLLVYVIGNWDDWMTCRGFDTLAEALEVVSR